MERLAFALLLAASALRAFADTDVVDGITWTFTVSNGKATVGGGNTSSPAVPTATTGALSVPASLGTYPVTAIADYAFYNCASLTSVSIPNGVTSIGSSAFYKCSGLESVTIPGTVSSFGSAAFRSCGSLGSVELPTGLLSVPSMLCYDCSSLSSVSIPQTVTSIGASAFYGCAGLPSVSIPDGVTSIGTYAFSGCATLSEINIPAAVDSIGSNAFSGCTGLERISLTGADLSGRWWETAGFPASCSVECRNGSGELVWTWTDGAYVAPANGVDWRFEVSGQRATVVGVSGLQGQTTLSIPSSFEGLPVTAIGGSAFFGLEELTSVTMPDGVTTIGTNAFDGCIGLTSIALPDAVTSIGSKAFNGCSGLASIAMPGSVKTLGPNVFLGCPQSMETRIRLVDSSAWATNKINYFLKGTRRLFVGDEEVTTIVVPDGVTSIGNNVFRDCSTLTSIVIPDGVTAIGQSAFYNCSGLSSITIPDGVTSIGSSAFSGCSGLASITIPDGVTAIGQSAFYNCSGLSSITIPDGVTSIGSSAFSGCSGLASITIPNGVTAIGSQAFYNCSGLSSITIPSSVKSVASLAFSNCSKLEETRVQLSNASAWATNRINSNLKGNRRLFVGDEEVTTIVVPAGVTSIAPYTFRDCSMLTSVTIPESVTSIGIWAFANCSGLESITIPESVTSIGIWAFANCSGLESITIPESVTSIAHYTFCDCSMLTSVTIPESVTSIGAFAFSNCSGLESITIPEFVTSVGDGAFDNCSNAVSIAVLGNVTNDWSSSAPFLRCYNVRTLSLGSKMTKIGNYMFNGLRNVEFVTIPENVTSIGFNAFMGCSSLRNVEIGSHVTSIGERAFSSCAELMSIVIPESVTNIGNYAFQGCSGLTSVTIRGNVTNIGASAFSVNWNSTLKHINFLENAPQTVGQSAFSSGTVHVRPGSTGWGVDIPGTWNGRPIVYGLVYSALASVAGTGGQVVGGGDYDEGETATLRAVPADGCLLACWTGDITGAAAEVELPMTRDWTATAVFIPESAADRLAVERAEKNGLYSESQIRAMTAGDLLLDVSEGEVRIGVCLQENDNLSDANGWHVVELGADAVDVGADGSVDIRVPADADVRFFRLVVP